MKECSESLLEKGTFIAVPIPVEQVRTTGQNILEGIGFTVVVFGTLVLVSNLMGV